jgi:2-hydroxychromene-2-carboxylate isomerase
VLEQARARAATEALNTATSEAKAIGIFGTPSFVADGELFWGHDRLEDAIEWQHNLDQGNPG